MIFSSLTIDSFSEASSTRDTIVNSDFLYDIVEYVTDHVTITEAVFWLILLLLQNLTLLVCWQGLRLI